MKYFIQTYGCQMNVHESEKIAGVLEDYGYTCADKLEDADVVVFNTCCIREGAETKIFSNIGNIKPLKKVKKHLIVAVLGCMTQQKKSAENLKAKFPWIDIIIGTYNADKFADYFKQVVKQKAKVFSLYEKEQDIVENALIYRTSGRNAWVNITYGCDNFCSYCIVPYVRGRERSRKSENIIKECKQLISEGYKTITLLGQNVNSYGKGLEENINFPQLCEKICALEGDFRLKFMSSHPKDFSPELIDVIARNKKMSKVVHLPCQSGSNKILASMNRKYTREDYLAKINMLKQKVPNVILTSDFIVGFPGEEEQDFLDTCALVQEVRYNSIFAFIYSKRKGTVAESMDNQVDLRIKRERVNKLLEIQHEITKQKDEELVNCSLDCLLDTKGNEVIAISESGKTIRLLDKEENIEDKFYSVKIVKVEDGKVYGTIEK